MQVKLLLSYEERWFQVLLVKSRVRIMALGILGSLRAFAGAKLQNKAFWSAGKKTPAWLMVIDCVWALSPQRWRERFVSKSCVLRSSLQEGFSVGILSAVR